jgi:formylglycine-generating enzyme required for sulfatase activity
MNKLYSNLDEDAEVQIQPIVFGGKIFPKELARAIAPQPAEVLTTHIKPQPQETKSIDLGGGLTLELVRIPAGEFIMGDSNGTDNEKPASKVRIARDFWMGKLEISNAQYAIFDPMHDSHLEDVDFLQFERETRGYPLNNPNQPVCRVSYLRAVDFCKWLSKKTGLRFSLPSEAQWEYACRAGSTTKMNYGGVDVDFSKLANLADASLRNQEVYSWGLPAGAMQPWKPAVESSNDGFRVSSPVGSFAPNAWGLYDLHGNVAEWTQSDYLPYPYQENNSAKDSILKVVRGGSWYDRPFEATCATRSFYPAWRRVYNVGFRVICE